jgi:hypothetical protein
MAVTFFEHAHMDLPAKTQNACYKYTKESSYHVNTQVFPEVHLQSYLVYFVRAVFHKLS